MTESALYYYRARHYDPKTGRFLQSDPLPPRPEEMNAYVYVHNNPVTLTDPLGLATYWCQEGTWPFHVGVCQDSNCASLYPKDDLSFFYGPGTIISTKFEKNECQEVKSGCDQGTFDKCVSERLAADKANGQSWYGLVTRNCIGYANDVIMECALSCR